MPVAFFLDQAKIDGDIILLTSNCPTTARSTFMTREGGFLMITLRGLSIDGSMGTIRVAGIVADLTMRLSNIGTTPLYDIPGTIGM